MSKARLVAQLLAKRFMAEGRMTVIPQSIGSVEEGMQLASSRNKPNAWTETAAFAGLSVQAVGVEEGKAEPGVIIYATKGTAKSFKSLPKEIDEVRIVVRKIGLVSVNPDQANNATTEPKTHLRKERITCGSSCATAGGDAGTIGAVVKRLDDEKFFIMSNNHVLAGCNTIPLGMPILAPWPEDCRPDGCLPRSIARLAAVVALRVGDPQHVKPCEEDLALGALLSPDLVSSWQGGDDGYDTPAEIAEPISGMRVKKMGRTTGLTTAVVDTIVFDPTPIPCQTRDFKGNLWFKNIWYLLGSHSQFALPGDSGSLVVTEDGKKAVGVLFASSTKGDYGQMIPISHALKELKVSLVSGHGL